MSKRRQLLLPFTILGVLAVLTAGFVLWLKSQPAWEMTAKNTRGGLLLEFYLEEGETPVHSTVIEGHAVDIEIERVTRAEIPDEFAEVVAYDETLKPGLLRLNIDGVEVAVAEHWLTVDGETVSRVTD